RIGETALRGREDMLPLPPRSGGRLGGGRRQVASSLLSLFRAPPRPSALGGEGSWWAGPGVGAGGGSSGKPAVAVLVLLAAAAGAGIVAADLRALAHDRRLLALLVVGVGGFLVGAVAAGAGVLELGLAQSRFHLRALLGLDRGHLLLGAHAHARQQGHHLPLDLVQHLAEQLEGF